MSFTFRMAVREQTSTLIGIAGASGSGKTYSALRLARGLVGPDGRIAMLDTEARRGLHYADLFQFDHLDFEPPCTPERITEAAEAAQKAGYAAIVVDSASDEYEGIGGLQDIQHEALMRMATDKDTGEFNARRAEALTAPSWKDAKMRHKRMMAHLRQLRAHVIFCLRAEEKIKFEKVRNDRGYETTKIVPVGFQPICEKSFMYDMTASFLLLPDSPGVPKPIKLQEQHKTCFPAGALIDEDAGKRLAAWASGGTKPATSESPAPAPPATPASDQEAPPPQTMQPASAAAKKSVENIQRLVFQRIRDFIKNAEKSQALDEYIDATRSEREKLPKAGQDRLDAEYKAKRSELVAAGK